MVLTSPSLLFSVVCPLPLFPSLLIPFPKLSSYISPLKADTVRAILVAQVKYSFFRCNRIAPEFPNAEPAEYWRDTQTEADKTTTPSSFFFWTQHHPYLLAVLERLHLPPSNKHRNGSAAVQHASTTPAKKSINTLTCSAVFFFIHTHSVFPRVTLTTSLHASHHSGLPHPLLRAVSVPGSSSLFSPPIKLRSGKKGEKK